MPLLIFTRLSVFYHRVGLLPPIATAILSACHVATNKTELIPVSALIITTVTVCVIAFGVAGKSLDVVKTAYYKLPMAQTQLDIPSTGEPAIFVSIVAACLCVPRCIVVIAVRLFCLRQNPTVLNFIGPVTIIYLNIFAGIFIVGGFGAAGMLAAVSASAWIDCGHVNSNADDLIAELLCYEAARWLIGTSISSFVAFLVNICFIVTEVVLHFLKTVNSFQRTYDSETRYTIAK